MPRTMGLDWGERRIGVAVSDELGLTSQGVGVVYRRNDGRDVEELGGLVKEWDVARIVVGVPIRDDGTEGPTTPRAKAFADLLRERLAPVPVETWDESNTSVEANRILKERGLSWQESRKQVDRVAAAVMLQSWLDSRPPRPLGPAGAGASKQEAPE